MALTMYVLPAHLRAKHPFGKTERSSLQSAFWPARGFFGTYVRRELLRGKSNGVGFCANNGPGLFSTCVSFITIRLGRTLRSTRELRSLWATFFKGSVQFALVGIPSMTLPCSVSDFVGGWRWRTRLAGLAANRDHSLPRPRPKVPPSVPRRPPSLPTGKHSS